MPFPKIFGFLNNFSLNLGGTNGSLGSDTNPVVFTSETKAPKIEKKPTWSTDFEK